MRVLIIELNVARETAVGQRGLVTLWSQTKFWASPEKHVAWKSCIYLPL